MGIFGDAFKILGHMTPAESRLANVARNSFNDVVQPTALTHPAAFKPAPGYVRPTPSAPVYTKKNPAANFKNSSLPYEEHPSGFREGKDWQYEEGRRENYSAISMNDDASTRLSKLANIDQDDYRWVPSDPEKSYIDPHPYTPEESYNFMFKGKKRTIESYDRGEEAAALAQGATLKNTADTIIDLIARQHREFVEAGGVRPPEVKVRTLRPSQLTPQRIKYQEQSDLLRARGEYRDAVDARRAKWYQDRRDAEATERIAYAGETPPITRKVIKQESEKIADQYHAKQLAKPRTSPFTASSNEPELPVPKNHAYRSPSDPKRIDYGSEEENIEYSYKRGYGRGAVWMQEHPDSPSPITGTRMSPEYNAQNELSGEFPEVKRTRFENSVDDLSRDNPYNMEFIVRRGGVDMYHPSSDEEKELYKKYLDEEADKLNPLSRNNFNPKSSGTRLIDDDGDRARKAAEVIKQEDRFAAKSSRAAEARKSKTPLESDIRARKAEADRYTGLGNRRRRWVGATKSWQEGTEPLKVDDGMAPLMAYYKFAKGYDNETIIKLTEAKALDSAMSKAASEASKEKAASQVYNYDASSGLTRAQWTLMKQRELRNLDSPPSSKGQ